MARSHRLAKGLLACGGLNLPLLENARALSDRQPDAGTAIDSTWTIVRLFAIIISPTTRQYTPMSLPRKIVSADMGAIWPYRYCTVTTSKRPLGAQADRCVLAP